MPDSVTLSPSARPFKALVHQGAAVFGFLLLAASILLINVLQTGSLVLLPISGKLFRAVNRWFADTWWGACTVWIREVSGVETIITGDEIPPGENAIVIVNHQSMADIPAIFPFAEARGRLGDFKWFVKDILKYVPGIGWGMLFLDCIFLKRDWNADRGRIERTFARLRAHGVPFWLVSFVEGTRRTPEKLARSQAYAREKGLPVLQRLLIPRTKGFVASLQALRQETSAVYDLTIAYEGEVPTLRQYFSGKTRRVRVQVRRYPVSGLPADDAGLGRWLMERFVEKDELLGRLPG